MVGLVSQNCLMAQWSVLLNFFLSAAAAEGQRC